MTAVCELKPDIQPTFSFASASRQAPVQYSRVVCNGDRRWWLRNVSFLL
jgi:hypothetical protein